MRVAAIGYDKNILNSLETERIEIDYFDKLEAVQEKEFDVFFINNPSLLNGHKAFTEKLVLVNAVANTLKSLTHTDNYYRVNHWPSFVENNQWEIVGKPSAALDELFTALDKKYLFVSDEIGLITPRILAMIINEAHYAIAEKVSSPSEIDIAMKLGTGYPQGPIEWGKEIGLDKIFELLEILSQTNDRYLPSPLLTQLAFKK